MDIPKPFIQIGEHLINMNAIVAVTHQQSGALRIVTTAARNGSARTFMVPAEHAEEFNRQIFPYISMHAEDVQALEE